MYRHVHFLGTSPTQPGPDVRRRAEEIICIRIVSYFVLLCVGYTTGLESFQECQPIFLFSFFFFLIFSFCFSSFLSFCPCASVIPCCFLFLCIFSNCFSLSALAIPHLAESRALKSYPFFLFPCWPSSCPPRIAVLLQTFFVITCHLARHGCSYTPLSAGLSRGRSDYVSL